MIAFLRRDPGLSPLHREATSFPGNNRMNRIGQLFVLGFSGTRLEDPILRLIRKYDIGGVILFSRNLKDPMQTAELALELQENAATPLLIGIDQEGGIVSRLPSPFTSFPGNRPIGLSGSEDLARTFGRVTGTELAAVGINLDFAPVLDVDSNPKNPVIGVRSFGRDPDRVARLGCAVIQGLQETGVIACGKHFPGHGDTSLDSHLTLPEVHQKRNILLNREVSPFAKAIRSGVEMIMTAHVLYPALDPRFPATLSAAVIEKLLRGSLGFQGVVITDDLEMDAVEMNFGIEESCVRALRAGVDMLLICHDPVKQEKGIAAVIRAAKRGILSHRRIDEAVSRILDLKRRRLSLPFRIDPQRIRRQVGSREHSEVAAEIASYLPETSRNDGAPPRKRR